MPQGASSFGEAPRLLPLLRLLQLASPSFPVGAYAYSQGLEQAVERGWIKDAASLGAWIGGVLEHSLVATDLPLLYLARSAWDADQADEISALGQLTLALRETRELRAEERQLGVSLARALAALGVERARAFVTDRPASFVVLYALAGAHFGIRPAEVASAFAFSWAENQVLAASRVMALGQSDAQRVLLALAERIPSAICRAESTGPEELGCSSFGQCMASAWHERQYSRLFRS